jgi:hypothetical protein
MASVRNSRYRFAARTLLRLSDGYWLRAQVAYDTEIAREKMRDVLAGIKQWQPKEPSPV